MRPASHATCAIRPACLRAAFVLAVAVATPASAQTMVAMRDPVAWDALDMAIRSSAWRVGDVGARFRDTFHLILDEGRSVDASVFAADRSASQRDGQPDALSLRLNARLNLSNGTAWLRLGGSRRRRGASLSVELTY